MRGPELRIAWLLNGDALAQADGAIHDRLSTAADAGFRVVAIDPSMVTVDCALEIESEAKQLGLQVIRVDEVANCRLASVLDGSERRREAHALSKAEFEGFIICEGCGGPTLDRSLFATARALLRELDQLDWESYH